MINVLIEWAPAGGLTCYRHSGAISNASTSRPKVFSFGFVVVRVKAPATIIGHTIGQTEIYFQYHPLILGFIRQEMLFTAGHLSKSNIHTDYS